MTCESQSAVPARRLETGITGLDRILDGGLTVGSAYLILGGPGAGKTVLSSQILFHRVKHGEQVLLVSMLGETTTKWVENVASLAFFDRAAVGAALEVVNGYSLAEQEGLDGLYEMLRRVMTTRTRSLVVLDSLASLHALAHSEDELRRFLARVIAAAQVTNTTFLALSNLPADQVQPEMVLTDAVIELTRVCTGMRTAREVEVIKSRGSSALEGRHALTIDSTGVSIYPRTEGWIVRADCERSGSARKLPFGVARLDQMLRGGLIDGSSTALIGPPGAGKTVLGTQFLAAGAASGERCLYFGFFETPPRLIRKAEGIGLPLGRYLREGTFRALWQPAAELLLDEVADRLMKNVREMGAKRVFLDGVDGLAASAVHPDRMPRFLAALTHELRCEGVTALFSEEAAIVGGMLPAHAISPAFENVILLRYIEVRSQLFRLISILKLRESDYDSSIREFRITSSGVDVERTWESAESILGGTGVPHALRKAFDEEEDEGS